MPQLVTPLINDVDYGEPVTVPIPCLTTPLSVLFDTGESFAVFGEAGAGKTTTLQVYSKNRNTKHPDKITLFIALAQLITPEFRRRHKITNAVLSQDPENTRVSDGLKSFIDIYLQEKGFNATFDEILSSAKDVVVLLDGVDEVIEILPEVPAAVREMSLLFPHVQFIISSRLSGEYVWHVPFHAVTIRPFTTEQRDFFIKAWFIGEANVEKGDEVIVHLRTHKEVGEVIRNPLLATVLCVLAENDVPLPDREIRLYQERTELYVGRYDSTQKGLDKLIKKYKIFNVLISPA